MSNGRPTDRPAGLAQTIPAGRCLDVGGHLVWVKTARCGSAEIGDGVVYTVVPEGDCIKVNEEITVWVGQARAGSARLVVDAPRHIPISRPNPDNTSDIP